MKLSVCCLTYNRPHLIGELIQSFELQTLPLSQRELIILDDSGQYDNLRGSNWQVVSFPRRFATLGEKRNACISLASPDCKYIVIADDDDIYLPWWLECHASIFEKGGDWSFASLAYVSCDNEIRGQWRYRDDNNLFHPAHAFSRTEFWNVGGYPHLAGWEDNQLFQKFLARGMVHEDSLSNGQKPFLIYRRFSGERHMTGVSVADYQTKYEPVLPSSKIEIGWKRDYVKDIDDYEKALNLANKNPNG